MHLQYARIHQFKLFGFVLMLQDIQLVQDDLNELNGTQVLHQSWSGDQIQGIHFVLSNLTRWVSALEQSFNTDHVREEIYFQLFNKSWSSDWLLSLSCRIIHQQLARNFILEMTLVCTALLQDIVAARISFHKHLFFNLFDLKVTLHLAVQDFCLRNVIKEERDLCGRLCCFLGSTLSKVQFSF